MARLILAGYFGCGNQGDDAILLGFLHGLEATGARHEYRVMSGSPELMMRNHNLSGFDRKDMRAYKEELKSADAVVFAGGSIFQDTTSLRSVVYYQELVKQAKKAGKKVFMLGQGVGPLGGFLAKRLTADAFRAADVVTVRDPGSMTTLQGLGVKRPIKVTADSALLMPAPPESGDGGTFSVAGRTSIAVIPRAWGKGAQTAELFSEFCALLFRNEMMPVLIEMDSKNDALLIDQIEKVGRISHMRKVQSPVTIQQRLARMDGVVSMRLHGGILAAGVGLVPLMVSYDPKTSAFSRLLGLDNPPNIENLTPVRLFEIFKEHQRLRDKMKGPVAAKYAELRKLAEGNVMVVEEAFAARV